MNKCVTVLNRFVGWCLFVTQQLSAFVYIIIINHHMRLAWVLSCSPFLRNQTHTRHTWLEYFNVIYSHSNDA